MEQFDLERAYLCSDRKLVDDYLCKLEKAFHKYKKSRASGLNNTIVGFTYFIVWSRFLILFFREAFVGPRFVSIGRGLPTLLWRAFLSGSLSLIPGRRARIRRFRQWTS